MAYKRKRIEPTKVQLLDLDPDGETFVIVHRADGGDEVFVENIANESGFTWRTESGTRVEEKVPTIPYLVKAARVYACMDECNIIGDKGKRYFPKEKVEWQQFLELWNGLIREEREAVYRAVVQVNPQWGDPTTGASI